MSAPTHTAASSPTGFKMPDGYRAIMAHATNAALSLWEKTIKPGGTDGGDPIDTTTMRNTAWHTMSPRTLKKSLPIVVTGMYDPDENLEVLINKAESKTLYWPDGSYTDFYGYVQKNEYGELKEGEPPEVTQTIIVTNWDPVGKVEQGPVHSSSSGT